MYKFSQTCVRLMLEKREISLDLLIFLLSGLGWIFFLTFTIMFHRQNVVLIEKIRGVGRKLKKIRKRTVSIPGTTYALNKKNNDMCNSIFQ